MLGGRTQKGDHQKKNPGGGRVGKGNSLKSLQSNSKRLHTIETEENAKKKIAERRFRLFRKGDLVQK